MPVSIAIACGIAEAAVIEIETPAAASSIVHSVRYPGPGSRKPVHALAQPYMVDI
jgi:hypothetical protein